MPGGDVVPQQTLCQAAVSGLHCASGGSDGRVPAAAPRFSQSKSGHKPAFRDVCVRQQEGREGGGKKEEKHTF